MDFGLTAEQQQLGDAERSWLERHDPIARLRMTLDSGAVKLDPEAVQHAADSGSLALLTPDMGGTHADLAVLAEAHGYAGSSLPVADLALAAWLLALVEAPHAVAAAEGRALYGVARLGAQSPDNSSPVPMAADLAGVVIVGSSEDGEHAIVLEEPDLVGMSTLDLSRTWARARVGGSHGFRAPLPAGTAALVRDALALHRGLDAVGAAARLLEMTVTYATQREQFGVPIGSFQAVKHHCANMALGVEAGRSVLWGGALTLDTERSAATRARTVSAAAAYAKAAAAEAAGIALQVHGGIGFTWEHDLHLFLRRIKVDQAMDGTVAEHRAAALGPQAVA